MSETGIILSEGTFRRFDDAARAFESATPRGQNRGVFQSPIVQYLKVVAGSTNANGYPAYVQGTTDGGLTWANIGESVRVRNPDGSALEEGDYVHARFAGTNATAEGCFIVIGFGDVIQLDYVSKICVSKSSGVVTDITVERKTIRLLGVVLDDETYCTTGDEDCCPTVAVSCCAEELPRCLKVTFANGTGFWSCLDGSSIYLVFDSVTEQWVCASTTVTSCNDGADIRIYASAIVRCVAEDTLDLRLYLNYDDNASEPPDGTHPCYASGQLFFTCDDLPETWTGEVVTCNPEPDGNTIDFTLAAADCDEVPGDDGGGGGGDPGEDGCCTDTADLTMWVNGTGDFEANYGDGLTLEYDPEGIVVGLDAAGGCEALVDMFQWMGTLASASESPVFFFGCKDGVYYIGWKVGGFSGGFAAEGCFDYTSVPANHEGCSNEAFGYVAVDSHNCEGSTFAELLLTGDGETACEGTIQFTVYR